MAVSVTGKVLHTSVFIDYLPSVFEHAGRLFRILYGDGSGLDDRLGPVNDLLIALSARQMGAAVVTSNLQEFRQIASRVSGLRIVAPVTPFCRTGQTPCALAGAIRGLEGFSVQVSGSEAFPDTRNLTPDICTPKPETRNPNTVSPFSNLPLPHWTKVQYTGFQLFDRNT